MVKNNKNAVSKKMAAKIANKNNKCKHISLQTIRK